MSKPSKPGSPKSPSPASGPSRPRSAGPCPFAAQLVALLLADELSLPGDGTPLYARLIALETEARLHGASRKTRAVIARVRRIAGTAEIIPFPMHQRRA